MNSGFHVAEVDLTVYKKVVKTFEGYPLADKHVVIVLTIPKGTRYYVGTHMGYLKCRAERAVVKELDGECPSGCNCVHTHKSYYYNHSSDSPFLYTLGAIVLPDAFDEEPRCCTSGIHFFFREQEAIDYRL